MIKFKLLINSLAMLIQRLIQSISTFVLTTIIARNLGAEDLGQYVLAIGYYYIFVIFFGMGLKTVFTRDLSRNGENPSVYLVSGSVLQFILSIFAYLFLTLVVFLMPYSDKASLVCYIMGLSVIPFALSNITEAILQAQEKMHLIALSTSPIYILRLIVSIWAVFQHPEYALDYIAVIMAISELIILVFQWLLLTRTVKPKWEIDKTFIVDSLLAAKTFFAIDGAGIIAGKLDIVFISLLGSEVLVGIYGAMKQLIQPFEIICSSLCSASFPRISQSVLLSIREQRKTTENFLNILLTISLPLIPIVFFIHGKNILLFVYKNPEFALGELPLKIMSITVALLPIVNLLHYVLVTNHLERFSLYEIFITTLFGGLAGIFLISQYKLVGAACMLVAMSCITCGVLIYALEKYLFVIRWKDVVIRPILLTAVMVSVAFITQGLHFNLLVDLSLSIAIYIAIGSVVLIREFGGITFLKRSLNRIF